MTGLFRSILIFLSVLGILLVTLFSVVSIQADNSVQEADETDLLAIIHGKMLSADSTGLSSSQQFGYQFPERTDSPQTLTGNIAFESDRSGRFALFAKDADGLRPAIVQVSSSGNDVTPAWSPDGLQMVFVSDRDGDFDIYRRTAEGQEIKLTENSVSDFHPSWSPDGDRILFVSNRDSSYYQIYSMRPDGRDVQVMVSVSGQNVLYPHFSPDSRRISYMQASVMAPICQWNWDVWVMDAGGGNRRQVTTNLAGDLYPRWTPDGSEIVYGACKNFLDADLYAINPDTGSEYRLNSWFLSNEWGAIFSPDVEHMAFNTDIDGNVDIYIATFANNTATNFTPNSADDLAASWAGQQAPSPKYNISGHVKNGVTGETLAGVRISNGAGQIATTDSGGYYFIPNVPAGTYTITAALQGWTFAPDFQDITVPSDSQVNFEGYDKYPIVFVHGWQGDLLSDKICPESERGDRFAGSNGYFESVDDDLRNLGYYVAYASLVTSDCYTPKVQENAQHVKSAILKAKEDTNRKEVILIGHSMGGLVSRAYVEGEQYADDVEMLFTFGSPHAGVPVDPLTTIHNFSLSDQDYCEEKEPFLCQLANMDSFNDIHKAHPDVDYYLVSGAASFRNLNVLGKGGAALLAGDDDGSIQVDSGLAVEGYHHTLETDEAHRISVGDPNYFSYRNGGPSRSYEQCLTPVLLDKDSDTTCGTENTVAASSQTQVSATASHTPLLQGVLLPGQTLTHDLTLEGGSTMAATRWFTGTVGVTLVDPHGVTINPGYAEAHPDQVTYEVDETIALYDFTSVESGIWQVILQGGSDIPVEGAPYNLLAIFDSALDFTAKSDSRWYRPGNSATFTVSLSPIPLVASVVAELLFPEDGTEVLELTDIGGGRYQVSTLIPNTPGYAEARFTVTGSTQEGKAFERGQIIAFQVSPVSVTLDGTYTDAPHPRTTGSDYYDSLDVLADISVSTTTTVTLAADLVDSDGMVVAHAINTSSVDTDDASISLSFYGDDIFAARRNGPYTLTHVILVDQSGITLVLDEIDDAYITAAYGFHRFASGVVYLPTMLR